MLGYANSSSRAEIRDFLTKVSQTLTSYGDLDERFPRGAPTAFAAAARQIDDAAARYQQPFRLAVVGEFNAGKTALINALLGRPGLLLEGVTPTTGAVSEIWWGEEENGQVFDGAGRLVFEGPLAAAIPFSDQRTPQGASIAGQGARIVLRVHSDLLRNLVVIDTPGLGASQRDDQVTLESLYLADAALLVVNGLQPGGQDALALAERLRTTRRRFLVVVTRLDQTRDRADSLAAAAEAMGGMADGPPVGVATPAIAQALEELARAERDHDEATAAQATEQLAASGYAALRDRLETSFLAGDAALTRVMTTLSTVSGQLAHLQSMAAHAAKTDEEGAQSLLQELNAAERHIAESLRPKITYINLKIDEVVDLHIADFVNLLSDAVALHLDRLASHGLRAGLRQLTAITEARKAKIKRKMVAEFEEILPPSHLQVVVSQISRSVQSVMEVEWNRTLADFNSGVVAQHFDPSGVVEQVTTQMAKIGGALLGAVGLLFVPGGPLIDLGILVFLRGADSAHTNLPQTVEMAKRDARIRILVQRKKLVFDLGRQYYKINESTGNGLIAQATDGTAAQRERHTETLQRLARWTAAIEDVKRLLDSGDELAGRGVTR